jgi:DNA-binding response OmpR family regulator
VGQSRSVVIADPRADERAHMRQVVADAAQEGGHDATIHEAEDGEVARELIAAHKPVLVICEVLLPGLSGLSLLRRLRARPDEPAPPVIFVTHLTRDSDRYWGLRMGAFAYLMKPYDEAVLRERVASVLAGGPAAHPDRLTLA